MSIEQNFNIPFVAALALREKQIQQNYRPIIAVHKWFARRPGTLFRALVLSEFGDGPVQDLFFKNNSFQGKRVADPFMGGGIPLLEANRVGCDVQGFDINPMATWIVREEIEHLDLAAYRESSDELIRGLRSELEALYVTDCPLYGEKNVPAKYFIWVKEIDCEACGGPVSLFPGYLLAEDARHPRNVVICSCCGELNEVEHLKKLGHCRSCAVRLVLQGPAKRGVCACPKCAHKNRYPRPAEGPPRHRLVALEYFNPARKQGHAGRFFKKPDAKDHKRAQQARDRWEAATSRFVPTESILPGDETDRLHRWGYAKYRDLFNSRQLLGLELSARLISKVKEERVRHALATNLSDLLRYQNMLCRYDSMALKSLDVFSVHGFPIGLVQCESNLIGITNVSGNGVGSGGWSNIVEKYAKAKRYCDEPFEVLVQGTKRTQIPIPGEWIGEHRPGAVSRDVRIHCGSGTDVNLEPDSLDAVFTDPPYFGNVQYGELMDFCYVWLRRLASKDAEGFDRRSTRDADELTANVTLGRGLEHFTEGLSATFGNMARALKPGAPLVFTYHHNKLEAYAAIGVAILDAGFSCTAALPCPAEMGGSIHIHGTGSSIVDTVFVCRPQDLGQRSSPLWTSLSSAVADDVEQLRAGGMVPSKGDIRCVTFGHATRLAIAALRPLWDAEQPTNTKLTAFTNALASVGDLADAMERADGLSQSDTHGRRHAVAV